MNKHVNELKFDGDDEWTQKFNHCSDLYAKANDKKLTEKEKEDAWEEFVQARIRLEMGM